MNDNSCVDKLREYQKRSGYVAITKDVLEDALKKMDTTKLGISKSFIDDYISNILDDLPTEYQDPLTYDILKNLFKRVEKAALLLQNNDFYFPENLVYGTAKIKSFSAFVEANVCSKEFLILLSNELFTFANLLSKCVGMLFIDENTKNIIKGNYKYNISKDHIRTSIVKNKNAIVRFTDLILAYTIEGEPEFAKPYMPDKVLANISSLIRDSFELFVVGHEYSHILLRHFEKDENTKSNPKKIIYIKDEKVETVFNNWNQEINADVLGAYLTILSMRGFDFATSFMGVDICLMAMCILETIAEQFKGKKLSYSTHPPGLSRREIVFEVLKKEHPEIEDIYEINTYIFDNLWNESMKIIMEIDSFLKKEFKLSVFDVQYPLIRSLMYKIADIIIK